MSLLKRGRLIVAWFVALYLASMYVQMGWVKFYPEGFWTGAFERWGYPVWLRLAVGAVEVAAGVMILVPWTAAYGALALAAVMAGAWVTRFQDGRMVDAMWITLYTTALLWIAFEWWGWRRPGRRARPRDGGGLPGRARETT